jgi:Bax protein
MTSFRASLPILLFVLLFSACGKAAESARMDLVESEPSQVVVSPKALEDRVEILMDLLEAGLPPKLSDRAEKLAFFKKISPAVAESMLEVEGERKIVIDYRDAKKSGTVTSELESEIADLLRRYKTKDVADLLQRVDVEPLDMLFTQASIESQWGRSPVARDCRNIFGVHAATAAQKCAGHPILAYYPSFTGSIERYMLLLNTGSAFKKYRQIRSRLRSQVGEFGAFDSTALVQGLLPYSERGQAYVNSIKAGMRSAHLDEIYREFIQKIF